ncbi:MAG TPA: ABC transporter permease [Tepidiformaceae bacterium]|nr:ABC transporter permease [Tepidiformaceae bacterium]
MGRYVTQRLLLAGLTLVLVSIIVFTLLRVIVPLVYGDAVDIIAAEYGGTDPELVQELKDDYGLSDALVPQYLRWVGSILRGDLGQSLFNGRPVSKEIQDRLPVSVELGLVGLISSVIFSVPLGIAAAVAQNRWPDYFLRTSAILVDSIPGFWLAIMIITFGSVWFNWAPPLRFEYLHDDPMTHLKIMALPALLIGLTPSGSLIRLVRTQMLEVMRQDYIRTAHAKGLSGRAVVISHAVRNAILPVVTVIGLSLPGLIAGTAIFESIFSLPGMGQYLVSSVGNLDYPVIMATVFIFSVLIVLSNLAVDISYTIIDPRIRL